MTARTLAAGLGLLLVACADDPVETPLGPDDGPFRQQPDMALMVRIPASTFAMGHPVVAPGGYGQPWKENELPEHTVTLPGYHIDRSEVTVADYAAFLTEAGRAVHWHVLQPIVVDGHMFTPVPGSEQRPIALVSWYDASTYCAWAGKRLPTEAEWERAARGPAGRTYPWGDDDPPDCSRAVYFTGATLCADAPQDVGGRSPLGDSEEGLWDMAGNVAEWVRDVYDRYPSESLDDPTGPPVGPYRTVRGGGFHEARNAIRALARWAADPADRSAGVGFRCALR